MFLSTCAVVDTVRDSTGKCIQHCISCLNLWWNFSFIWFFKICFHVLKSGGRAFDNFSQCYCVLIAPVVAFKKILFSMLFTTMLRIYASVTVWNVFELSLGKKSSSLEDWLTETSGHLRKVYGYVTWINITDPLRPIRCSEIHIWYVLKNTESSLVKLNVRSRPRAVDYLFHFPCSFPVVLHPPSDREDAARATLVPHLNIWPKQPSFFLISLCPLLFKNSAEKEKTIFQNILAVISRKYSERLGLSSLDPAGGRNMAGWSFCLLATHDRPIHYSLCFWDILTLNF